MKKKQTGTKIGDLLAEAQAMINALGVSHATLLGQAKDVVALERERIEKSGDQERMVAIRMLNRAVIDAEFVEASR